MTLTDCVLRVNDTAPPFLGPEGEPKALRTTASNVHLYRCRLEGGMGKDGNRQQSVSPGSTALRMDAGFVFASGCTFTGGDGGTGHPDEGFGCEDGSRGGDGVHLATGNPRLVLHDSPTTGGAGGLAGAAACAAGAAGRNLRVDSGSADLLGGLARRLSAPRVLLGNEPFTLTFEGTQGDSVWLALSTGFLPRFSTFLSGSLLLATPLLTSPQGFVLDPSGVLEVRLVAPNVAPLTGQVLFLQAAFFDAFGTLTLSSGRAMLLVESTAGP